MRDILIHAIMFHELIHVIECCTGTLIFEHPNDTVTLQLARRYFEGYACQNDSLPKGKSAKSQI